MPRHYSIYLYLQGIWYPWIGLVWRVSLAPGVHVYFYSFIPSHTLSENHSRTYFIPENATDHHGERTHIRQCFRRHGPFIYAGYLNFVRFEKRLYFMSNSSTVHTRGIQAQAQMFIND